MTEQICLDVEKLIVDKLHDTNELMYVVYEFSPFYEMENGKETRDQMVFLVVQRSMLDPKWHVRVTRVHNFGDRTHRYAPILCRTKETLEHVLLHAFQGVDKQWSDDGLHYELVCEYAQGLAWPPEDVIKNVTYGGHSSQRYSFFDMDRHWNPGTEWGMFVEELMEDVELLVATA